MRHALSPEKISDMKGRFSPLKGERRVVCVNPVGVAWILMRTSHASSLWNGEDQMRKTPLVLLSTSVISIVRSTLDWDEDIGGHGESLRHLPARSTKQTLQCSLDPTPQNAPFHLGIGRWRSKPSGLPRVVGGKHRDGTTMYICRGNSWD